MTSRRLLPSAALALLALAAAPARAEEDPPAPSAHAAHAPHAQAATSAPSDAVFIPAGNPELGLAAHPGANAHPPVAPSAHSGAHGPGAHARTAAAIASTAPVAAHTAPAHTEPAAHGSEPAAHTHAQPADPHAAAHGESAAAPAHAEAAPDHAADQLASLLRIGDAKLASKDLEAAIIAYRQASRLGEGDARAPGLLGLARAYRQSGDSVKAVATYELLCQDHPDWEQLPVALLELGRTLREVGAPKLAMNRFYSVIHSTLKLPEARAELYRQLVRTAQFEIAETHLAMGDHAEAVRFFRRMDLLDLAPGDRARARFRVAQALLLGGDRAGARASLAKFITEDGEAEDAPEARFLLARLLAEDGRREEALQVTLDLLRHGRKVGDSPAWRAWQRRAGNLLANRFYEEGEFYSALLLYRALNLLDDTPAWRGPVLYQIALCLERMRQPEAARDAYAELIKLVGENPPADLADLGRMAAWRSSQLDWTNRVRGEIQALPAKTAAPDSADNAAPPAALSTATQP